MNPRRGPRRVPAGLLKGPKRLGNLPPQLRAYWKRVRAGRRIQNPRAKSRRAKTVTTLMRSVRRTNPRRGSSLMAHRSRLTAHQRRVRAGRKAARTRARRYGSSGRRRRAVAADFGINPRPKHRRRSRHVRHHINPRRRSSGGGSFNMRSAGREFVLPAAVGAGGAVAIDYAWQYVSGYLPASLTTGYIGTGVKAGAAIGIGWLASKAVGKKTAAIAVGGALTVIAYQLFHQLIAQAAPAAAIPATTTSATPAVSSGAAGYMMRGPLGWTSPAPMLRGLGGVGRLAAYSPASRPNFAPAPAPAVVRPGGSVSMTGLASPGGW